MELIALATEMSLAGFGLVRGSRSPNGEIVVFVKFVVAYPVEFCTQRDGLDQVASSAYFQSAV